MTLALTTFLAAMLAALGSVVFVFTSFSDDPAKPLAHAYGKAFAVLGMLIVGIAMLVVVHMLHRQLGEASRYWLLFLGPLYVHVMLMSTLVNGGEWARRLENPHFRLAAKVAGGLALTLGAALTPVYTLLQHAGQ